MTRQLRGTNHLRVSNGGYSPGAASGAEAEVGAVAVTPPNHLSSPPGAVTPPVTTLPPLPSHRFSHFSDVCRAGRGVIAVNCSRRGRQVYRLIECEQYLRRQRRCRRHPTATGHAHRGCIANV